MWQIYNAIRVCANVQHTTSHTHGSCQTYINLWLLDNYSALPAGSNTRATSHGSVTHPHHTWNVTYTHIIKLFGGTYKNSVDRNLRSEYICGEHWRLDMTKFEMATAIVATYKPCGVGEVTLITNLMATKTKAELIALYDNSGYEMRTRIINRLSDFQSIHVITHCY